MTSAGSTAQEYRVEIVTVPSRRVAVHRFRANVDEIGQKVGEAFGIVMRFAGMHGLELGGPAITHYDMRGDGFDVAAGFPVAAPFDGDAEVGMLELPACQVASVTHVGPYDQLMHAYEAVREQALAMGRKLDEGAMWEEYWTGPETPVDQHKTVVMWPVAPS